jgi:hypothetical protein
MPLFIMVPVPVPNLDSELSCIQVLEGQQVCLCFCGFLKFDFGTVPTLWDFLIKIFINFVYDFD